MRNGKWGALLCALLVFALVVDVQASVEWPNEPDGSTTLLECSFVNQLCNRALQDPYNSSGLNPSPPSAGSLTIQSDPTAPVSPPSVLQSKLTYPNKQGGTELHYFAPRDIRNVYVSFWWNPGPFGGNVVGVNKTFFVRSGYSGSNGVFLWVYRAGDTLGTNGNLGDLYWNTQIIGTNTDRCGSEGLRCNPNTSTNIKIFPNTGYHHIEARLVASSCPTCYDGSVQWWVDGSLVGNYQNFAYSTSLKEWLWSETWDGFGNGTVPPGYTGDNVHRIDHLHISSTDCRNGECTLSGDSGQTGTPPPPPGPTPTPPALPGVVQDLAVAILSQSTALVTFTQQNDGTGTPAAYDNRLAAGTMNWGTASSISSGPCATTYRPSGAIGTVVSCILSGLTPGQSYQLQNVSLRGIPNQGATYAAMLSNVVSFTMPFDQAPSPPPFVSGFTPASGMEGVSVVVSGNDFDSTISGNTVKLNGQIVVVTAASATSISFIVPSGATSGRISVQTSHGISVSFGSFSVTPVVVPLDSSGCGCG